jgi:hypothetical protein
MPFDLGRNLAKSLSFILKCNDDYSFFNKLCFFASLFFFVYYRWECYQNIYTEHVHFCLLLVGAQLDHLHKLCDVFKKKNACTNLSIQRSKLLEIERHEWTILQEF